VKSGRAIIFKGIGQVELAPISIPDLQENEVLVQTLVTGISQGTDRTMLAGTYRGVQDRYPLIYGYLRVGKVLETGRSVTRVAPGDRVFAGLSGSRLEPNDGYGPSGGAYTSHGVVHETDLVRLPNDISDDLAAICGLGAVAYEGVAMSNVRPRQRTLVTGLGAIGQFSALFSVLAGAEVAAADPIDSRRDLANTLCGVTTFDPGAVQLSEALTKWAPETTRPWPGRNGVPTSGYEQLRWQQAGGPIDVAIDTTGKADLVNSYIGMMNREGTICLQGYYGGDIVFDHHAAHLKRLSFRLPGGMDLQDYETVMNHARLRPDLEQLVQRRIPLERVPMELQQLLENPTEAVGAVIDWT
jgi:2-desacetyl-2-hydroxyethyl bacteriochlorophyllide A dehydrogenase